MEENLRFLHIFLNIGSIIILIVIQYIQANLFNLYSPNNYVTWSETLPSPFILECSFKFFLSLAHHFRSNLIISYIFIATCSAIVIYKYYVRVKKSFMFNSTLRIILLVKDSLFLHLFVLLLPAFMIKKETYIIYVILTSPFTLMISFYFTYKIQNGKEYFNMKNIKDEKNKLFTFYMFIHNDKDIKHDL